MLLALTLLLLSSVIVAESQINQCLYNREDVAPCENSDGILTPGPNQYTIHTTRILRGANGYPICVKLLDGQIRKDISNVGGVKFKVYSPGAELLSPINYPNQILVEYNIRCEENHVIFIDFDKFDLEPKNCANRCRDYLSINAGTLGQVEYCGNISDIERRPHFLTDHLTLKFRTSYANSYPGFLAFVKCIGPGATSNDAKVSIGTENGIANQDTAPNVHTPSTIKTTSGSSSVDIFSAHLQQQLERMLSTKERKESSVHLEGKATMMAVMHENDPNPTVHSIAKAYLTIAQRIDPQLVEKARQVYQHENSQA